MRNQSKEMEHGKTQANQMKFFCIFGNIKTKKLHLNFRTPDLIHVFYHGRNDNKSYELNGSTSNITSPSLNFSFRFFTPLSCSYLTARHRPQ